MSSKQNYYPDLLEEITQRAEVFRDDYRERDITIRANYHAENIGWIIRVCMSEDIDYKPYENLYLKECRRDE